MKTWLAAICFGLAGCASQPDQNMIESNQIESQTFASTKRWRAQNPTNIDHLALSEGADALRAYSHLDSISTSDFYTYILVNDMDIKDRGTALRAARFLAWLDASTVALSEDKSDARGDIERGILAELASEK